MPALLEVDINVDYPTRPRALEGVRFTLEERDSLAVLGESGSGKSTLILAVLGLLESTGARVSGRIRFGGVDLLGLPAKRWRSIRGRDLAFVPQSPLAALNPALRIGSQMSEAWRVHESSQKDEWKRAALALFERVSLPTTDEFLRRFPGQISVGQAQRVLIAMALLHRPRLLISDEPTSAVDPATRDSIRTLLRELSAEFGIANLLITHDIAIAGGLCTRAMILRNGKMLRVANMSDLPWRQADAYAQTLSALYADSSAEGLLGLSAALEAEAAATAVTIE
jgi:ABC-type glutathione transport system ATPase component